MLIAATLLLLKTPFTVDRDIVFATIGQTPLKCDVYKPEVSGTTKAVAVFYGGAWISGKKEDVKAACEGLAAQGYTAVAFQYRLAPTHKYPAMIDDARTGVRWLRSKAKDFNIDPKRIASMGFSAGGHLSLLLGYSDVKGVQPYGEFSSKTQVVLDFFGPTDLSNTSDYPKNLDGVFALVLGKARDKAIEEVKAASPINYVNKDSAATFIYQGLADPLVNPHQSRILEEALNKAKVPVEAIYLEDVKHEAPMTNPKVQEAVAKSVAFLKKHL